MATISNPTAFRAVVAALLLLGLGVGVPIDIARGDDNCVSAPGAVTPTGQHWYYRTDQVKHRKCWYLHATVPVANHAPAKAPAAPALATPQSNSTGTTQSANPAPAPQPAANTSNSVIEPASTLPAPHVTLLSVKPAPALLAGTRSAPPAGTPDQTGEPPTPQISPSNAQVPLNGDAKPASGVAPETLPPAQDTAHNELAPADSAATSSAQTPSAYLFLLLALAFGIAAALIAVLTKMTRVRRTLRVSDHPDDAWRRVSYEEDAPSLAPHDPHGPADSDAQEWIHWSPTARHGP